MEQEVAIPDVEAERIVDDLNIPPCPEVLTKLLGEMRRDEPDYMVMSNLISADVSLAAAMLKTVNSPFFGLRSKATSVKQALTLLGLRNVKEVVTGLLLKNCLPLGESAAMEHFWETSSGIAQTASLLAKPLGGVDREDAYTFALFRDCGLPLMVKHYPEYDQFYSEAISGTQPFTEAEQAKFGMNHARVGAQLAQSWHLPDESCKAIALSHDYLALSADEVPAKVRKLIALALVAEHIHARCTSSGECPEWVKGGSAAIVALGINEDAIEAQMEMVEGILGL